MKEEKVDPNRCFCKTSEGASQPSTNPGPGLERTWETGSHWSQHGEPSCCRLCWQLTGCGSPPGLQSGGNRAAVQSAVQMKAPIIPISKNRLMLSGRRTYAEVGVLQLPADALRTILVAVSQDLPAALPASSSPSTVPALQGCLLRGDGANALHRLHPRHTQNLQTGWSDTCEGGHGLAWLNSYLTKGKTCSEVSG